MLVIGYGALGACAAIEAYDNGSKVLIIEKMAQPGGNTAISSGGFMVPQDGPTALKYLTATYDLANSEKDDELLNTFCKEIMGVKDWMTGLKDGTELWVYGHAGFQNLPGCKAALQVAMMAPSFIWWTRTANGLRTNSLRTVILVATLLIVLIRSLIALRLFLAGSFLTTRHSNADL